MLLKEQILKEINSMSLIELSHLYETIYFIKNKSDSKEKNHFTESLEKVHQLVSGSKKSWSSLLLEEREERY